MRLCFQTLREVKSLSLKRTTTASMAASWITMSKVLVNSVVAIDRYLWASIRWPVLEIGRNSVRPSTMERIMICGKVMVYSPNFTILSNFSKFLIRNWVLLVEITPSF